MKPLRTLTFCLLACLPVSISMVTTVGEVSVLEGRPLTVPCHYDPQYVNHVKYWCRGQFREFCSTLARTDAHQPVGPGDDGVSIFDDPAQLVFTVTMKTTKEADSGWYWCVVEVGTMWRVDLSASVYLNIIHGMSVVNSMMSGEEGSSITVECLYSEKYRNSVKRWCRSGDWSSCLLVDANGLYEDASVAIIDDKIGTLAVTLRDLRLRDGGWYLCAAGKQQMSVHVQVTTRSTTTVSSVTSLTTPNQSSAYLPPPKHTKASADKNRHILESVVVCVSLVVLVGIIIFAVKMWIQQKKERRLRQARLNDCQGDFSDLQNGAVVFLNKDSQHVNVF